MSHPSPDREALNARWQALEAERASATPERQAEIDREQDEIEATHSKAWLAQVKEIRDDPGEPVSVIKDGEYELWLFREPGMVRCECWYHGQYSEAGVRGPEADNIPNEQIEHMARNIWRMGRRTR